MGGCGRSVSDRVLVFVSKLRRYGGTGYMLISRRVAPSEMVLTSLAICFPRIGYVLVEGAIGACHDPFYESAKSSQYAEYIESSWITSNESLREESRCKENKEKIEGGRNNAARQTGQTHEI